MAGSQFSTTGSAATEGLIRRAGHPDIDKSLNEIQKNIGLIGNSLAVDQLLRDVVRSGCSRATVLVRGETGVGKELVARALHYSSRRKGRFVCLNCAALNESLLESELFGHERGAFTGATGRKIGKFEAAHQGTLMLDEIGEMSPSIQAKFLRVLEGHPFERIGGNRPITVDVRVIAATHRDLEAAVSEGKFRKDLYYRLHVVEIAIPPLRKRGDDVIVLAEHFLKRFNSETGQNLRGFTSDALDLLRQYRWPGNVRELENVVERAVVLAQNTQIDVDDLTLSNLDTSGKSRESPAKEDEPPSLTPYPRQFVRESVANVVDAARLDRQLANRISAPEVFVEITGDVTLAILLSDIIDATRSNSKCEWVHCPIAKWETRYKLTKKAQSSRITKLTTLGLISVHHDPQNKRFLQVNWGRLNEAILTVEKSQR